MNYQINLIEKNGKNKVSRPSFILLTLLFTAAAVFLIYFFLNYFEQRLNTQVFLAEAELAKRRTASVSLLELREELDDAQVKIKIASTLLPAMQSNSILINEIRSSALSGIDINSILIEPGLAVEISGCSSSMRHAAIYRENLAGLRYIACADLLEVNLTGNGSYNFTIVLKLNSKNGDDYLAPADN